VIYIFYKIYIISNIEFLNLISEIKNFLFQKLNLKASLMETTIDKHDQQFNSDNIEFKEYNKKEKILIAVGCIVVFFCMYVFFNNNVNVETLVEQVPQIIEQVPQIIEQVPQIIEQVPQIVEQIPVYQNWDFVKSVLENSCDSDESFRSFLAGDNSISSIDNKIRLELAQALLTRHENIDFPQPLDEAQRLIDIFRPRIEYFILVQRNTW